MAEARSSLLIAQLTDIHIGFDRDAGADELNRTRLRQVLARLSEGPNPVDMLVLSGDLVEHGDQESYEALLAMLRGCACPIYPMVGNHDQRAEFLRAFPDCPGEGGFVHYAVERDGLLLLFLDTLEPGRHGGGFCQTRADWLARQLAAHPDTPTLIFLHHPPIISGIGWMDPGAEEGWMRRLGDTIAGHGQIQALHCGHLHRPVMARFHGVPLGIAPSVAPPVALDLRPIMPDQPDNRALIVEEPPAYALHRWDGQRLVTHYEMVSDANVAARYDATLQPVIRQFLEEKGQAGNV